jgi:LPXTG-motif cell wall-anchored protein
LANHKSIRASRYAAAAAGSQLREVPPDGAASCAPAAATPSTPPGPSFETCANLKGWYVNPDEASRRPIPTEAGLKFVGNDLVHHGATGNIEGLSPGSFVASPAPDQPSFFSVEVINADGTGYATLRWNTVTSKWNMTTGGQFYENASASALVDMPAVKKSHNLLSFGVGYTNSPPGTVDTVVSSVMFRDVKYDLTCKPKPSASPSKSALPSNSSAPAVVPAGNQATLPITGSKVPAIVGAGVLLILAGALLAYAVRRRRTEFR